MPVRSSKLSILLFLGPLLVLTALLLADGCARHPKKLYMSEVEGGELRSHVGNIRIHMKDSSLYVLYAWSARADKKLLVGRGKHYSVERDEHTEGVFNIPFGDVALIETRNPEFVRSVWSGIILGEVAVVSSVSLSFTLFCAVNPKACWGSCPTFYVSRDGGWKLQAEGFSTSVARILEAGDLDALPDAAANRGPFEIQMRNEALETHVVRSLELVEVRTPPGTTAWKTPGGRFAALGAPASAVACEAGAGGCLEALGRRDGKDFYLSPSAEDLAERTSIVLTFPPPGTTRAAVAVSARNSLLSTFVFYHTLALFGTEAAGFIADLERGDMEKILSLWRFDEILGGIDVDVRQGHAGSWKHEGTIAFTGPVAYDHTAVPVELDDPDRPFQVRLRFAFSHWKIDRAAACPLEAEDVEPRGIPPAGVTIKGKEDGGGLAKLLDDGSALVMFPGDAVNVVFDASPGEPGPRAYFLRSRGYYYEWLREVWLKEEDIETAEKIISSPREALRFLAPRYHELEPGMEEVFRNSKINVRNP